MTRYTDWIEHKQGDPIPGGRGQVRFEDGWESEGVNALCAWTWGWNESSDYRITHYRRVIKEGAGTITHAQLREVVEWLFGEADCYATSCHDFGKGQARGLSEAASELRRRFPEAFKESGE